MTDCRAFDEMSHANGEVREAYAGLSSWLDGLSPGLLERKCVEASRFLRQREFSGAETASVSGHDGGFDPIPRVFTRSEWNVLAEGVLQRVKALNRFLHDIYHRAEIIRSNRIPADAVFGNRLYQVHMHGFDVPGGIYTAVASVDLVRVGERRFMVAEDRLEPSTGLARMLENRALTEQLFPGLAANHNVASLETSADRLLQVLRSLAADGIHEPNIVQLLAASSVDGYFESISLAGRMGVEVVRAEDLHVWNGRIHMRTTGGSAAIDVIHHATDDEYLDPLLLDPVSVQGVAGLISVYRSGGVALANAMGTAIAGDPHLRRWIPEMIRFYLGEEPLLEDAPVIRDGEGGERKSRSALPLSNCPGLIESERGRWPVILRLFVLCGQTMEVLPGALTCVVNSRVLDKATQVIATKDTWVLEA